MFIFTTAVKESVLRKVAGKAFKLRITLDDRNAETAGGIDATNV